ncbi:TPA: heavy metal-responsive transcriptional regulator [Legionella pneumophila]
MPGLTIGQVAKQVGMSRDAIRIYERQGLIEDPDRSPSGYRLYSTAAISRLRFIQRAKAMGFSLKEIGELLEIKRTATNTCEQVRAEANVKLKQVETKMAELQRLQKALKTLIKTCDSNTENSQCPLLDALEQEDLKEKQ